MENKPINREHLVDDMFWSDFRAQFNSPPVPESVVNDLVKFCRRHKQTKTNYTDP